MPEVPIKRSGAKTLAKLSASACKYMAKWASVIVLHIQSLPWRRQRGEGDEGKRERSDKPMNKNEARLTAGREKRKGRENCPVSYYARPLALQLFRTMYSNGVCALFARAASQAVDGGKDERGSRSAHARE